MRLEVHRTSRLEVPRSGRPWTSTSTCPKVVGFFPFRVQIIECGEPVHQSFSRREPVCLAVSRLVFTGVTSFCVRAPGSRTRRRRDESKYVQPEPGRRVTCPGPSIDAREKAKTCGPRLLSSFHCGVASR